LPHSIIPQAPATLEALETQQRSGQAQVDLFAAPPALPEPETVREPSALEEALASIDPDTLTPREALDALYRLKTLIAEAT
jgi:DNA mismatch repair protein MutS